MELRKFIATTIREYLNEQYDISSYITLKELYSNDYPKQHELIWEYVSQYDFEKN